MRRREAPPADVLRAWLRHPILARMRREAPGSHYHSALVAALAEAGAEALGLDALYVHVGARFHDIGKLHRPDHYQENQRGADPLARMAPAARARAIRAHVDEGLRFAREIDLPDALACFIPEHHGARVLDALYRQAVDAAGRAAPDPDDFTYPGPWPRSAETAVVLFADAAEAAARTEPLADRGAIEETLVRMGRGFAEAGSFAGAGMDEADWKALAGIFAGLLAAALEG